MDILAAKITIVKDPEVILTHPPKFCQLCSRLITGEVISGRTLLGAWADMCPKCHAYVGRGLGVGKGQHYKLIKGQYKKIAG